MDRQVIELKFEQRLIYSKVAIATASEARREAIQNVS